MGVEDYRRMSQDVWQAMAPGWERWRGQLANALTPVRRWLIAELRLRLGETVLELGAGTGETGFEAAPILGEGGRLISSDFSPAMVEVARRRGTELAETRRVLRPGGRLALSVWGPPERNPWASIGGMILVERGHMPPPEPGAPGVFSLASEERAGALLAGAGFSSVRMAEVAVRFTFRGLDDYERWVTEVGGPFAMVVRGLAEDKREMLRARLGEAFVPFAADGGYELPGAALCAVAS